jgi:1-aminocyclopropane-1-carboxylate deaminase/D-cysteine desulfhydrase-like pyridoxal-dependent ACC family enzyme
MGRWQNGDPPDWNLRGVSALWLLGWSQRERRVKGRRQAVIDAERLERRLQRIPRQPLCHLPTPLESWQSLADAWHPGSHILAKRDDLTGLALGGNKARQLEFVLGDALANNSDVVIHGGAVQSNYCRQLAAAAAMLGIECRLVLSTAYGQPLNQGGHLLDRLFDAKITLVDCPLGIEHERKKAEVANELRRQGRRPYLITYPNSETLGSLGYVTAAIELADQLESWPGELPKRIVMAGVGATYSGLLLGLRLLGINTPLVAFAPLRDEYDIASELGRTVLATARVLGVEVPESITKEIDVRFDQVGAGYAVPTPDSLAALFDTARNQGVLLDPVYTSKAMAGLKSLLQPEETTLFLHTGGAPGVFAYSDLLVSRLDAADREDRGGFRAQSLPRDQVVDSSAWQVD